MPTAVYVEVGRRKTFACALDWPGWARAGRGEEAALEALAHYAARYAAIPAEAGIRFPKAAGDDFTVEERLAGSATTDFGAPDQTPAADREPLTARQAARLATLVEASWTVFDRVVAGAPAELRKGPRGGGRDRDAIVAHVVGSEAGYARALGIRLPKEAQSGSRAVGDLRQAITSALQAARAATPATPKGWLPRYAARRIAWHVLDHAWEIEDRSL